jgi:hypothetical protein
MLTAVGSGGGAPAAGGAAPAASGGAAPADEEKPEEKKEEAKEECVLLRIGIFLSMLILFAGPTTTWASVSSTKRLAQSPPNPSHVLFRSHHSPTRTTPRLPPFPLPRSRNIVSLSPLLGYSGGRIGWISKNVRIQNLYSMRLLWFAWMV